MNGNSSNKPHELGTDEMRKAYQTDTPGQEVDKFIKDAQKVQTENAKKHFSQVFGNPLEGYPYNEEMEVFDKSLNEAKEELEIEEDSDEGLKKKAEKSGMPLGILKQVFKRGVAAWRTGHRPGTNPQQWGYARVNSFVTKSKGTWGGADKDLAAKVGGS